MTLAISANSFQAWRTPKYIFDALARDYGPFDLDAAADADNAMCPRYLTEEQDALSLLTPWRATQVWCNPPYKKILPWVKRAYDAVAMQECKQVVMLLPAQVSSKWFAYAYQRGSIDVYQGRIAFDLPEGMVNLRRPAIANLVVAFYHNASGSVPLAVRSAKTGELLK